MKQILLTVIFILAGISGALAEWQIKSAPVPLTAGEENYFMQPAWSPDGVLIAFTAAQYQGLWVADVRSGALRQLSNDTGAGFGFNWSNDGAAIVARVSLYENFRRRSALKLFEVSTDQARLLSDFQSGRMSPPALTDHSRRAYVVEGQDLAFFDTGIETTAPSADPLLAFIRNGKIAVTKSDGSNLQVFDPLEGQRYLNLTLSPDGQRLAFEVVGGDLYVMGVDGSGLTDLGVGYRPQWSPDSRYLAYMVTEDDGHQYLSADIYIASADGSEIVNLTNSDNLMEVNPSWSPDGKQLAFNSYEDGVIYIVEIENN